MANNTTIAKRQAVLDRLFPDPKPYWHKFSATTGKCEKCNLKFVDWLTELPDGRYQGGPLLCPIIGADEVAQFNDPFDIIRGDDGGY